MALSWAAVTGSKGDTTSISPEAPRRIWSGSRRWVGKPGKCSQRHIARGNITGKLIPNRREGMLARDGVFLEDLCPKSHDRRWRGSLHQLTGRRCLYCGDPSQSIDHVRPLSRGGLSVTENCVPACLSCNGQKGDSDVFLWYRQQTFYDPRRAMALRAWLEGDLRLAQRLLAWTKPNDGGPDPQTSDPKGPHQTRQATSPRWRWQMAS